MTGNVDIKEELFISYSSSVGEESRSDQEFSPVSGQFVDSNGAVVPTVEVDGNMYVVSTMIDQSTGELINVMHLMSDVGAQEGLNLGGMSLEMDTTTSSNLNRYVMNVVDEGNERVNPELLGVQVQDEESDQVIDEEYIDDDEQELFEAEDGSIYIRNNTLHHEKYPMTLKQESESTTVAEEFELEINYSSRAEESSGTKKRVMDPFGKVRNKDKMDLPFTYSGQTFTVQAQKLILNVYDFFKKTKRDPFVLKKIGTPQEAAGKILNVSSSVIGKIRNRFKELGRLEIGGRRRRKPKRVLDFVDSEKEEVLREIVKEFDDKGVTPTVAQVMAEAVRRIGFKGSRTSFRRVLRRMGYIYAKHTNRKTILLAPKILHD